MPLAVTRLLLASSVLGLATSGHAQSAAVVGEEAPETIIVFGRGEARQVSDISQEQIRLLPPGSSPFRAIEKLPGVNFQSADPFGAYEWSTRITLRGFSQNQLGFTLDGIPLGDMSYGNTNGLHISRAIISDNIASTRVSQGAGALATASTSNLGGTMEFTSRNPAETFGIAANASYGSEDSHRLFLRLDTGDLGRFRLSLSYAYLDAVKWKGDGNQRHHQANAKIVMDLVDSVTVSGFLNYSDRRENDYQDLSLEMIRRLGYRWDNLAPDWQRAVLVAHVARNRGDVGGPPTNPAAGTIYPAPIASVDDAYFDAAGLRRDWLAGLRIDADVLPGLTLSVSPYYHDNKGQGIWFTPYVATPGGAPISVRTTEYDIQRYGLLLDAGLELGNHDIQFGLWAENNDFVQGRRFYGLAAGDRPSRRSLSFQRDPFFTQWRFGFNTGTVQVYVQDRWQLSEDVSLIFGFKGNRVANRSSRQLPGSSPAEGRISSADWFLPQAGLVWQTGEAELFANYTENRRAFTSAATGVSPFATTQAGFDAIRSSLKPETSRTVEAGVRLGTGNVRGVLAAYHVDFANRLLGITTGAGIIGNPVVLQNVGSVRSIGAEMGLLFRPLPDMSLLASYSYNDSTYRDDVVNSAGTVLARIRGKRVADTPQHMVKADLAWDPKSGPFGRIGATYMSKRFFTYTNDQSVGARTLVDATIGWRFGSEGWARGLALQGSVTNLFDRKYVATIGSNGFGNSGDNQTLLAGAPRQWFITLRREH